MLEGNDRYEGYCVDLLHEINTIFNFTYNITTVDAYGSYDKKTDKWNGLIGELMEGVSNDQIGNLRRKHINRWLRVKYYMILFVA